MTTFRTFRALALFLGTALASCSQDQVCVDGPGIQIFSAETYQGDSTYQTHACETGFDGPKVNNINDTSIDWWYFDAVGHDATSSISIVFFNEGDGAGFPTPMRDNVPAIQITGSFSNGSAFNHIILASEAIVSTVGQGSSGLWRNATGSWVGAPDLSYYQVTLDAPAVSGTFTLKTTAPPHVPCGPVVPGASIEIVPGMGWANAVPDADAVVNMTIDGLPLMFEGIGYHDKNWAVTPYNEVLGTWYWGHARLGPYSLSWIDALTHDMESFTSAYVALDGEILVADCGIVRVRPTGGDLSYPPTPDTGIPTSYRIEMELGNGDFLTADMRGSATSLAFQDYTRYVGPINGTVGDEALEGLASFEMFNFFLSPNETAPYKRHRMH